jgi:hemolysin III
MDVFDIRESVSALIHGVAFLAVIPAAIALWMRANCFTRRMAVASYGIGLAFCFASSTAFHTLNALGYNAKTAVLIDHIGIFLLIAGTYTPIVTTLLPPKRRRATLWIVWGVAISGAILNLLTGPLPAPIATSFYLAMGWGGLWSYFGAHSTLSHRDLAAVPLGGVIYSVGAAFHLAKGPNIWPGVIGGHELFHLFVVVAAATHFAFIWTHIGRADPYSIETIARPRPNYLERAKAKTQRSDGTG